MTEAHALTIRLPGSIYRTAKRLARAEGVSVNALVSAAIADKARRTATKRLSRAYDLLGADLAEANVEGLLEAQVEALLRDV
jgi:post-segregation antitoxin (ccd killing protein)